MTRHSKSLSRRSFLQSSTAASCAAFLKVGMPSLLAMTQAACSARDEGAAFRVLGADEAADRAAIAARIFPATDTPGANELGVIYFFDRALGAEMQGALAPLRSFIADLNAGAGQSGRFSALSDEAQDALLEAHEQDDRFETCRLATLFGVFGMARHGGNKDHASWRLIGFEGHHGAWESPFGYYDAEYLKEHGHGE